MAEQQTTQIKRQTAYKCSISALISGMFVKTSGWESNYVMTDYGDFSRVNIIAVVVSKEENNVSLDDGTGVINARSFDNPEIFSEINVGDIIITVARPREFNNQLYLTVEIIRRIEPGWVAYRKKELSLLKKIRNVEELKGQKPKEPEIVQSASTSNSKDRLLRIIAQLDKGEGAGIDDVIKLSGVSYAEEMIQDMILKGELFEAKPGRLKILT